MKGERMRAGGLSKALMALMIGMGSGGAQADLRYNMPAGVTEVSRGVHDLHMTMFWVCVGIGLLVFSAIIYSIVRFRKSAESRLYGSNF